jgi:hypothetical protein
MTGFVGSNDQCKAENQEEEIRGVGQPNVDSALMNDIPLILLVGFGLVLVIGLYLAGHQRAAAIRSLAIRSGFHYLGNTLPRSLTLSGTPFDRASKVWNVIDGEPHGIRVVAFDCRVGVGKGSWRRSVIAAESSADLSRVVAFNHEIVIDSAGRWKILYRPKASVNFRVAGLTPIGELEAYLNSVAGAEARTTP